MIAVIAGHAWAAYSRVGIAMDWMADLVWSSVWLWLVMVAGAGLAYGWALAWSARDEQERLETHFSHHGAP